MSVVVHRSDWEKLKKIGDARNTSMSDMVRVGIGFFIENYEARNGKIT